MSVPEMTNQEQLHLRHMFITNSYQKLKIKIGTLRILPALFQSLLQNSVLGGIVTTLVCLHNPQKNIM